MYIINNKILKKKNQGAVELVIDPPNCVGSGYHNQVKTFLEQTQPSIES